MKLSHLFPVAFTTLSLLVACSDGAGGPTVSGNDAAAGTDAAAGNDAVAPGNDSGVTLGDPTPISIDFSGKCPAFAACGGSGVVGAWDYTGVCLDDPFTAVKQQCPSTTVKNLVGTVRGRVTFTAQTVNRVSKVDFSATLNLPASCTAGQCSAIEGSLKGAFDSATCVAAAGGCDCTISSSQTRGQTDGYSVQGTQIVISDGGKYDFCMSGSKMSYQPSGTSNDPKGFYELTKK